MLNPSLTRDGIIFTTPLLAMLASLSPLTSLTEESEKLGASAKNFEITSSFSALKIEQVA